MVKMKHFLLIQQSTMKYILSSNDNNSVVPTNNNDIQSNIVMIDNNRQFITNCFPLSYCSLCGTNRTCSLCSS